MASCTFQWSVDGADPDSISSVRRAVVAQFERSGARVNELARMERLLGELLAGHVREGHQALVVALESGQNRPAVHIYAQGRRLATIPSDPISRAIIDEARVPMLLEHSDQGVHLVLRLLLPHELPLRRRHLRAGSTHLCLNY